MDELLDFSSVEMDEEDMQNASAAMLRVAEDISDVLEEALAFVEKVPGEVIYGPAGEDYADEYKSLHTKMLNYVSLLETVSTNLSTSNANYVNVNNTAANNVSLDGQP